jgi:hypothetical protein
VARFQEEPKESHFVAVKRIFKYFKGIEEFGLWYPKEKDLSRISYTDALMTDEAPVKQRSTWISV